MSTRSALLAAFGQRVQIRDETPVREGSAERLSLRRLAGADLDTVAAARALVRRHLPMKAAHAVLTELSIPERLTSRCPRSRASTG